MKTTQDLNYNEAIELAPGIFWVGFYDPETTFACNPYLIVDGDEAILIDCGSFSHFPIVARKVISIIDPSKISHLVFQHMDPDLCASLPLFSQLIDNPELKFACHWRASLLIKYYSREKMNFYYPEKNDFAIKFRTGKTLGVLTAHYLHTPGTINVYDREQKTLFSSDLFGAFTPVGEWNLYADERYPEQMREFHENYMPSNDIVSRYVDKLDKMDIEMICSQHGSVIKEDLIGSAKAAMRDFKYGAYIEE